MHKVNLDGKLNLSFTNGQAFNIKLSLLEKEIQVEEIDADQQHPGWEYQYYPMGKTNTDQEYGSQRVSYYC